MVGRCRTDAGRVLNKYNFTLTYLTINVFDFQPGF